MALIDGMKDMINAIIQKSNTKPPIYGGDIVDDVKNKITSLLESETFNKQKLADDLTDILRPAAMQMLHSSKSGVVDSVKDKVEEIIRSNVLITQIKTRINELLDKGLGNDEIANAVKNKIQELLVGNSILDELQRKIQDLLNGEAVLNTVKIKINDLLKKKPTTGGPPEGPPGGPPRGPGRGPPRGPGRGPPRGPPEGPGRGPPEGPGRGPPEGPGRGPPEGPGRGPPEGPRRGPNKDVLDTTSSTTKESVDIPDGDVLRVDSIIDKEGIQIIEHVEKINI